LSLILRFDGADTVRLAATGDVVAESSFCCQAASSAVRFCPTPLLPLPLLPPGAFSGGQYRHCAPRWAQAAQGFSPLHFCLRRLQLSHALAIRWRGFFSGGAFDPDPRPGGGAIAGAEGAGAGGDVTEATEPAASAIVYSSGD
jgi:hypothetical protein